MDKRYEVYCLVDPLFYDATSQVGQQDTDYELGRRPLPEGWQRGRLEDWLMLTPAELDLPPQGWKVHVSACLDNAERVLDTVAAYCFPRGIPFKFLRSPDILLLNNAKYAHRASSGKFVAIYPADVAELERILTELGAQLAGSPGPYILSDLRWGDGPLYIRYGGFAERWCVDETGTLELAIEDGDGHLVPDRREPRFVTPPWMDLPAFLEPHLAARNGLKVDGLPFSIDRAVHFSNGGGVYRGRLQPGDEDIIVKEGRKYAGLDRDATDAVDRLHREHDILVRLAGLDAVPRVHGLTTLGDHTFLAMEFVEGEALRPQIVDRYPLVQLHPGPDAFREYAEWAVDLHGKVERAVRLLHDRGIVMTDLHPDNVLVRPDGRVALIDFEVSAGIEEGRRQTMAEPGFVAPPDRRGFDIDNWALACLRLYMFLPMTSLFGIDRAKAVDFARVIGETFPVPTAFLDEAVEVITAGTDRAELPRLPLDPERDGWEEIRASLAGAILASATPQRDDRLFPGDIEQFETGGLSLSYGAAGVLYALDITGAGRYPEYEEWLLDRAAQPTPGKTRLGFYDGLHGVAYVLDHLGHRTEAHKILELCTDELGGNWDRLGLGLHSGLAGIGLNLAHFAAVTGDPALRDTAFGVAQAVADRLGAEDAVAEVSGGSRPQAGLMYGSSGPALLFLRLYEQSREPALLDLARTALRQDLRRCLRMDDGTLQVNEGFRVMPYLADGSIGIGAVLAHYLAHRADEQFAEAAAAIRLSALPDFCIEPGLVHGKAGMILYLCQGRSGGAPTTDETVLGHIRRLAWHAIGYRGYTAMPGEELLRLSMDLATGNAGVLLGAGAALHSEPVNLPFLAPPQSLPV